MFRDDFLFSDFANLFVAEIFNFETPYKLYSIRM